MAIMGTNFNNGSTPVVTLGSSPTPLRIIAEPTAKQIEVACPVDALTTVPTCPVGDSLLKVTTGTGTGQKATYALTIGAVGPVGVPGAAGAPGTPGAPGQNGTFAMAGVHVVLGQDEPIAPREDLCAPAACPEGQIAVSGAAQTHPGSIAYLLASKPIFDGAGTGEVTGWQACAHNTSSTVTAFIQASVLCAPTAGSAAAQPTRETRGAICPSSGHLGHPCSISPQDLRCRVDTTHGSHLKGQLC
jgi:hypothetical protein